MFHLSKWRKIFGPGLPPVGKIEPTTTCGHKVGWFKIEDDTPPGFVICERCNERVPLRVIEMWWGERFRRKG